MLSCKKSEHFPFSSCLSMWKRKMAGQAMVEEAILEELQAAKDETPLESIEALVAQHSLMAFRIAYSILRNHHDAEDAVQECFLRVLKHLKRMHQVRNPKAWLARIAWTAALDRRASRARATMNEDASEAADLSQIPDKGLRADEQLA